MAFCNFPACSRAILCTVPNPRSQHSCLEHKGSMRPPTNVPVEAHSPYLVYPHKWLSCPDADPLLSSLSLKWLQR